MQPIQAIDSPPENNFSVELVEPIKSTPGLVVSVFLRSALRSKAIDNPKTKQKVTAKPPKKAKKAEAVVSSDVVLLPLIPQLIFCQKSNSFLLKDKEEILFHIVASEAKIVTEGWKRYGDHLTEEASLQRSHDLKKRKSQDHKDSQDKKFLIEREDIKKQDRRRDIQNDESSKVDTYEPIIEPIKQIGRNGKSSEETLALVTKRQACLMARRRQSVRGG